jgi:hypothetical protein
LLQCASTWTSPASTHRRLPGTLVEREDPQSRLPWGKERRGLHAPDWFWRVDVEWRSPHFGCLQLKSFKTDWQWCYLHGKPGIDVARTEVSGMSSRALCHLHAPGSAPELPDVARPKKPPRFWRGVRSLACVWRSVLSLLFNDTVSGWAILLTRTHAFFESLAFSPSLGLAVSALSGCYISNGRASARASPFDVTCCIWDVVQV